MEEVGILPRVLNLGLVGEQEEEEIGRAQSMW